MALRFQRRIKIAPGLRVNISKSGLGVSVGPRGAAVSVGSRGVHSHVAIAGTGLRHRQKLSASSIPQTESDVQASPEMIMRVKEDGKVTFELSDGSPAPASFVKRFRDRAGDRIKETLEDAVAAVNEALDQCLTIHLHTPAPDWSPLAPPDAPPPQPLKPQLKPIGLIQK